MRHSIQDEYENNFSPIKLTITIESEEELVDIFCRLNCGNRLEGAPKALRNVTIGLSSVCRKRKIEAFPSHGVKITVNYPTK